MEDKSIEQIVCYMDGDIEMNKVALQPPDIIGDNTEDYITGEETVYFDLRFTLTKINGETKILFDLEAQNDYNPGYPLVTRGIVYTARMISNQINTEFTTKNYQVWSKESIFHMGVFQCTETCRECNHKILHAPRKSSWRSANQKEYYDKLCIVQICLQKDCAEHGDKLIRLLNVCFSREIFRKSWQNPQNRV